MTTSPTTSVLYEVGEKLPIPLEKRAYFHARTANRIYAFVLKKFLEKEQSEGLTKAELARRIERTPAVISRLLGAPGNWTLETISDLLLGIAGEELEPASSSLLDRVPRNIDPISILNHLKNVNKPMLQVEGESQGNLPPIDPFLNGLVDKSHQKAALPIGLRISERIA